MSEMMSDPYDADESKDEKYDPDKAKCKVYNKGQSAVCMCVPKDEWKGATEKTLKSFYGKYNPEKLDKKGEIKDVDEVWKKWKGKESDMFLALATKYKAKAVDMRVKPKPPPYKPPKEYDTRKKEPAPEEEEASSSETATEEEPPLEPAPIADPEDEAFDNNLKELLAKKKRAAEDEDYDLADEAKEQTSQLTQEEVKRLKAKKAAAIENEDYVAAKKIKSRLASLEL